MSAKTFRNHYRCPFCACEWTDEWSAACDDDCPKCGCRHVCPVRSEEIGTAARATEIARRNDVLRRDRIGGHIMMTAAVNALPQAIQLGAIQTMRAFSDFTADNDPHHEHDFGAFDFGGERFFWKIDTYADASLTFGADDPLSPEAVRVLTLMLASDY